jgi:hypothetical protein
MYAHRNVINFTTQSENAKVLRYVIYFIPRCHFLRKYLRFTDISYSEQPRTGCLSNYSLVTSSSEGFPCFSSVFPGKPLEQLSLETNARAVFEKGREYYFTHTKHNSQPHYHLTSAVDEGSLRIPRA